MELNPHHPTTAILRDNWHKICAILMARANAEHVVITLPEIQRLEGMNITAQELSDGIHLRLVNDETARKLSIQQGGVSDAAHN